MLEYRYYITTALAVLSLQFLIFSFSRTQAWLFNLSRQARKVNLLAHYLIINSLVGVHLFTSMKLFRELALLLALLLFAFLVRLSTQLIYAVGKHFPQAAKLNSHLKIAYPVLLSGLISLTIYNAYVPNVVHYSITLDKPLAPLRIGVASDLHLGKLMGKHQLDKLATIFEQERVDLILLPGDIMDDNVEAYRAEKMKSSLAKLNAPLGVFSTLGNHDFFGHQQAIYDEIRQAGIEVLYDQAVVIDGKFAIIGRNDDLVKHRPSTEQLMQNLDPKLPIFLMDHRPTQVEAHSKLPIDLQVSGHTHKGQIFPANILTALIYRLDYGYEKIGLGHYVVTSGYGFWGIPMRLGSQAEVVIIDIKGK